MKYEVLNNYSLPMPSGDWVGASAEDELEVHVTDDYGIDVTVFVSVVAEVTYSSSGSYESPPEVETESSYEVSHHSYGREVTAHELAVIYNECVRIAFE